LHVTQNTEYVYIILLLLKFEPETSGLQAGALTITPLDYWVNSMLHVSVCASACVVYTFNIQCSNPISTCKLISSMQLHNYWLQLKT